MGELHIRLNLSGNFQQMMHGITARVNGALERMNRFNDSIRNTTQEANAMNNSMTNALSHMESSQNRFTNSLSNSNSGANKLLGTVRKIATAVGGIKLAKLAIDTSDDLTNSMSRLSMMNDGKQSDTDLWKMVYASAQNSRGDVGSMTSLVARLGNNAGDAFGSSAEIVKFANLVQKQFNIAGASSTEAQNATIQLSQALASGVLRGDELNSIFEQAPNLIQSVADYLNVPIGKIREMASEGELSTDVVKNAIFASESEIEKKYQSMPVTFSQTWQMIKNSAVDAFRPISNQLSELVNSGKFQNTVDTITHGLAKGFEYALNAVNNISDAFSDVKNKVSEVTSYIGDKWNTISNVLSSIAPVVLGIAGAMFTVKVATLAVNAAMEALSVIQGIVAATNPFALLVAGAGLFTGAIILTENTLGGFGDSGYNIFENLLGGMNVVKEGFIRLVQSFMNGLLGIGNAIAIFVQKSVDFLLQIPAVVGSVSTGIFEGINGTFAEVAESIGGGENAVSQFFSDNAEFWRQSKNGMYDWSANLADEFNSLNVTDAFGEGATTYGGLTEENWDAKAFESGAGTAKDLENKLKSIFSSKDGKKIDNETDVKKYMSKMNELAKVGNDIKNQAKKTSDNTDKINKNLSITSEDLKYLKDINERDVINRYTTAQIKVDMTNNNNVSKGSDLDGIVKHLRNKVEEEMVQAARGVHL